MALSFDRARTDHVDQAIAGYCAALPLAVKMFFSEKTKIEKPKIEIVEMKKSKNQKLPSSL
jgi:hypothetical protein